MIAGMFVCKITTFSFKYDLAICTGNEEIYFLNSQILESFTLYFFILNKHRAQLCQLTKHLHVCHVGDAQLFVAITDFMHKTKSLNHVILKNPTLAFPWFYNLQQTQTFFFNSRKVSNPFCLIKTSEKHQLAMASQMEAFRGSEVHLQ